VIEKPRILEMRDLVRKVPLARNVQDYAVRVLQATHPETAEATATSKKYLRYGASPRGLQAMILAAKIRALLQGRYAVAVDDVRAVSAPALRHRLILNFEGEAEGVRADTIIAEILQHTREAA
jgi:MoxR-like ATPase